MCERLSVYPVMVKTPGSGGLKGFIKGLCVKPLVLGRELRVIVHHGHCMPSSSQVPGACLHLFRSAKWEKLIYQM